jgi:hypothetical protein
MRQPESKSCFAAFVSHHPFGPSPLSRTPPLWSKNAAMNDDESGQQRLADLRDEHRRLDAELAALRDAGTAGQMEIARLKKRKLKLKDEIARLADDIVPDIIA